MRPYAVVDLHCDTLTRIKPPVQEYDSLDNAACYLQLSNLPEGVHWAQCYACFLPERYRGEDAIAFYNHQTDRFYRQMKRFSGKVKACETAEEIEAAWAEGKTAAVYTIENGSALAGRLERIGSVRADGVRILSLTWNAENEIASGSDTDHGLSAFGKEAVREMERTGIIVDVSHLNDTGFWELMEIAEKPFVATHSNARAVCSHKRNLTDDMIREMVRRGCLVGLNYYTAFLKDGGENLTPDDFYAHISHFCELGGEKLLALGSDGDGCTMPSYLNTPEKTAQMYDYLLERGLDRGLVDGIWYRNAMDFLKKNL